MINLGQIQAFSQQIVEKFHPERIILFGSYAYSQTTADSDVGLLVILPFDEIPVQKAIACVKVVDTFGCDTSIIVEVEV